MLLLNLLLQALYFHVHLPHFNFSFDSAIAHNTQFLQVLNLDLVEVICDLLLFSLVVHLGFGLACLQLFPLLRQLTFSLLNLLAALDHLLSARLQSLLLADDIGFTALQVALTGHI